LPNAGDALPRTGEAWHLHDIDIKVAAAVAAIQSAFARVTRRFLPA
jgi:hypothetical protein